jgi:predicted Zn-dependent peptidase
VLPARDGYKLNFVEYDLANGLHVILYPDNTAPNVVVGIKYHVGSKNEELDRTGFAHFFEHLQFHGTENIPQGEFDKIVMTAGGYSNAYTSYDYTYYYELFPAHEYKLGLWLESERMLHPILTQKGIDREREVVKEEKRLRYDNKPLGNAYNNLMSSLYNPKTYGHSMIGSMEHLDAASLKDFKQFFDTYYVPNNACLVLSGNIDIKETKKWIAHYFNDIPSGKEIKRPTDFGQPSGIEKIIEKTEKGIKHTFISMGYYVQPETHRDAVVLNVVSGLLSSNGDESYFKKNITSKDTTVNFLTSTPQLWEKVGYLEVKARLNTEGTEKELMAKIDTEFDKLKTDLVSDTDLTKLLNGYETGYTDMYFDTEMIANGLTSYHFSWGGASKFNNMLEGLLSVNKEEIRQVARKYLNQNNRTVIIYYPEKED